MTTTLTPEQTSFPAGLISELSERAFDLPSADGPWKKYSKCAGQGIDFFSEDPGVISTAKAICQTCPIQMQCLAASTLGADFETSGVWGGYDEYERSILRRRVSNRTRAIRAEFNRVQTQKTTESIAARIEFLRANTSKTLAEIATELNISDRKLYRVLNKIRDAAAGQNDVIAGSPESTPYGSDAA